MEPSSTRVVLREDSAQRRHTESGTDICLLLQMPSRLETSSRVRQISKLQSSSSASWLNQSQIDNDAICECISGFMGPRKFHPHHRCPFMFFQIAAFWCQVSTHSKMNHSMSICGMVAFSDQLTQSSSSDKKAKKLRGCRGNVLPVALMELLMRAILKKYPTC